MRCKPRPYLRTSFHERRKEREAANERAYFDLCTNVRKLNREWVARIGIENVGLPLSIIKRYTR